MKKNKMRFGLLLTVLAIVPALSGCKKEDSSSSNNGSSNIPDEETIERMVTNIIDSSNVNADVEIGPYESMLTGEVEETPEEARVFTSSTILDAPRDFETSVIYNSDVPNLQTVTNLLGDIRNANNELGTIAILDRGGNKHTSNLLTLADAGNELKITNPDGYEYGEVYQIEINDAPYLSFKGKSDSIRKLTIEIEDDPNEEETYDIKNIKTDITDISLDKVSNKKELAEQELFVFDYNDKFPDLSKGDIFYAHNEEDNLYFNFYGKFVSKEVVNENLERVTYAPATLDEIYNDFHLKGKEPVNMEEADVIINDDIAAAKFKQSGIARGIVKALLPHVNYKEEALTGIMDKMTIHVNANMVGNRLSTKFGISVSNVQLGSATSRWYFSLDIGYEKVTDYFMDFDVSVRTKWIFPVGVDYKVKCIEDSQEGFYVLISFSRALQPDRSQRDEQAERDFKETVAKEAQAVKNGDNSAYAYGDKELGPSTSGSRTSWPIVQVNINYFTPVTMKLQVDFYIDAAIQIDVLVKKETFSTKIDFNFTNMSGSDHDTATRTHSESNWVIAACGSIYIELGIRASFSLSILGLYDVLRVQAFAEWYVNLSATGMVVLGIATGDQPTGVTGYITIDLAITAGVRVGLNFKMLCFEYTISKVLWFDYLFRIKWENSVEHFSKLATTNIEMDGTQTVDIDELAVLWLTCFNSITMSQQEKLMKSDEKFSIFSGCMCPPFLKNWTGGYIFTFTPEDDNLIEISQDGVLHVKDGTPNEFTTTFNIAVSNWAGTASDQTVTVHFVARDTKEVYVDKTLIGDYRPGYQFTLPEGPFVYGKEFQGYILDGKEYKVGDKVTMSDETMHFLGKYRILPYYFVYFVDGKGNVVSEQRIMEGEAAIEPSAAMRDRFMDTEHYVFLNWTCDYSKVMCDLVINSVYMEVR